MRFLSSGDTALIVEFADTIDRAASARIVRLAAVIEAARLPGVIEVVPTIRSLMVVYDPTRTRRGELESKIGALESAPDAAGTPVRRWTIPVSYAEEDAPDLADVAAETRLSRDEAIARHAGVTYHVYMLGFLPGFAYMGDLDAALRLPRRRNPRTRVPAGSIAIAQQLTAIYPAESPGGWHLIGRTPVRFFDPGATPPALLAPGDQVRFAPISNAEYRKIAGAVAAGSLRLSYEAIG
ncbi:MAG TPA: 5-oxoprolinase subunit PxpB [Alphaproteobacteria bacterium]|nr:5-oxoprolinase subunit PxpB [Alphaproteobacteria bacterium]